MGARFLAVRWLCGTLLAGIAPVCMAEVLPAPKEQAYLEANKYQPPKNLAHIPNGCAQNQASLCFDYRSGHAVYKPMRKLLPEIPGMTPHNLSIHRNTIVAEYSFK